ncbi:tRNA guanosine(34) transglycosylase Tgt [Candidatus Haliotispira prima]|uniref:tRNA guanosine(34) transglycosylase Tgt n=1 Tax=Candidatus Haliotispira prima TaxID=3034016 RepID=A0ABY8ME79_9SPIO|nr:tRNA guanosine(34) transglycosylase Tgt [Candidatus Haliotispira prima]
MPQPAYCAVPSDFGFEFQPAPLTEPGLEGFRPRLGRLRCPHGAIATPNFIFCGTKANVKGMSSTALRAAHSDIVLANTYHLMLSPGADLIEQQGGLHHFMRWNGPLLSDSGGYQVFAMGHGSVSEEIKGKRNLPHNSQGSENRRKLLKITEQGASFRSYVDGAKIWLSPESSVAIQRQLGVDFMVQFDECTPYHVSREYTEASMEMSLRWGERSLAQFIAGDDGRQAIYGVIQGGVYPDLRRRSAAGVSALPFFGTAIGGCLGKTRSRMWQVTADTASLVRPDRPIHLLGIGHVPDIFWGVLQGIDTFDCVHPTRLARHGCAILPYACGHSEPGIRAAQVNLRKSCFRKDKSPLFAPKELLQESGQRPDQEQNQKPESETKAETKAGPEEGETRLGRLPDDLAYSKSYVRHLLRSGEMLGAQILTVNNVFQMNALMRNIRWGLREGRFAEVLYYWLGLSVPAFMAAIATGDEED